MLVYSKYEGGLPGGEGQGELKKAPGGAGGWVHSMRLCMREGAIGPRAVRCENPTLHESKSFEGCQHKTMSHAQWKVFWYLASVEW